MNGSPSRPPAGVSLLSRFARRFGLAPIPADAAQNLAELQTAVAALIQVQAENHTRLQTLHEAVEKLEKQLARAGKEQFKANTLAETQQRTFKTTLEQLREAEAYRERELAQLRERLATARGEGRLDVIKSVLPALDGLEAAISSGERLLKAKSPAAAIAQSHHGSRPASILQRLSAAARILFTSPASEAAPAEPVSPEAAEAWLTGITFVHDRLLEVLAAEGVYPIETEDAPFDPHLHAAVETVAATDGVEPGTIVHELRRGYALGETVLRYAEVAVAR